jgi:formylglycine-generating enzyme required for sulfatase activity
MKSLLFVFALLFVLPAHADSVLRISCEEQDIGAEITINGEFQGECPLDKRVKAGKLKLELIKPVDADRERKFTKEMRIGDGVIQKIEAVLQEFYTPAHMEKVQKAREEVLKAWEEAASKMRERQQNFTVTLDYFAQQGVRAGNGKTFKDCAACPDMALVPNGKFVMGDENGTFFSSGPLGASEPRHTVNLIGFAIARTEVTQAQWRAVMGTDPSTYKSCGDDCPVDSISFDDAQAYVRKLSEMTGKPYRLPSESEWEYACRAGKYEKYCGSDDLDAVAVYSKDDSYPTGTGRVAQKQPNAWGLYDMTGNVHEWVEDCWHSNYAMNRSAPDDGSAWTSFPKGGREAVGDNSCAWRGLRGGAVGSVYINRVNDKRYELLRAFFRERPEAKSHHLGGLRPVRTIEMTAKELPFYVEHECKRRADSYAKYRLGEVVSVDRATQRIEIKLDAPAAEDKSDVQGYAITKTRKKLPMRGNFVAGATNLAVETKEIADVSPGDTYYRGLPYFSQCWDNAAYCTLRQQTCPD